MKLKQALQFCVGLGLCNYYYSVTTFQENVACRPKNYKKVGTLVVDEGADLKDLLKLFRMERKKFKGNRK